MRRYYPVTGLSLPDASALPVVSATPQDLAIAAIPGWLAYFDPAHVTATAAQNGVTGALLTDSGTGDGLLTGTLGAMQSIAASDENNTRLLSDVALDPAAWTMFAVARPVVRTGSANNLVTWAGVEVEATIGPKFGFRADCSRLQVWGTNTAGSNADTGLRLSYTPETTFAGRTALVMATFSTQDGLRLYENGVLVASNGSDKAPLEARFGAGQWEWLAYGRGDYGNFGALSIDLGRAANAGYRRRLEAYLMTKYGIV